MAVTVSYSFGREGSLSPPFQNDHAGAAPLAGGGVAVVADYTSTQTTLALLQPDGTIRSSGMTVAGTGASVAALSNGRIVVAMDTGQEVSFSIFREDGRVAVTETTADGTFPDVSGVDVAGLAGGGFVVVSQAFIGGTDNDIRIVIRTSSGGLVNFGTADSSTANDRNPSVAALADGGFAVAWDRRLPSGAEELWYAVYEADGSVRLAPTMLDNEGSVNRNASVVALPGGGFAIAYEDTGWSADTDIDLTLARFTAAGNFIDWHDVSQNAVHDTDPSTTVLSNGMIVVGSTLDNGSAPTDVRWVLVDPATGEKLAASTIGSTAHYERSTAVAAMLDGRLATFFTDNDTGNVDGNVLQATRTSIGDTADDLIVGDALRDVMAGGGGNDVLKGGAGSDFLEGNTGRDVLTGGAGADTLMGNGGADRFDFNSLRDSLPGVGTRDLIADFTAGDLIDLSTLDANTLVGGNQAFTFIGNAAFTGAGQVRYANGFLLLNVDNDKAVDMQIQLLGSPPLTASDLLL